MFDEMKRQLSEYEIVPISRQNFEKIFEVYETNQPYFLLTQGDKASIESSVGDMDALPPDCVVEQKMYVSLWKNGKAVGVLDLIEKYPEPTGFWIGLLLIHGDLHGQRLGSEVVRAILNAGKAAGYRSAQLGVIENNIKALSFWQKHGFERFRHSGNVVVMARPIS